MKQNRSFYNLFRSATTRLTGWYLLMIMLISLIFSATIYNLATGEVETRLTRFQDSMQRSFSRPFLPNFEDARSDEQAKAAANLYERLVFINILIFAFGGIASYFLARKSLQPIERAHESQSRFTSDASHELRTPLAAMKTEIEVALKDKSATPSELREVLSSNLEEVNKLTKLSEMLLNMSRLENTKLKLGPVNLNKIVKEKLGDFGQTASRISMEKTLRQHVVYGDETAIADLIKILIDNALQYSPPNSHVSIRLSRQGECARFEITNSGDGIEPDKLEHIFERFYRADSSRTNGGHRGFGLGLALAKNIVELHEGRLFVKSAPGIETAFTFLLPLNHKFQAKSK